LEFVPLTFPLPGFMSPVFGSLSNSAPRFETTLPFCQAGTFAATALGAAATARTLAHAAPSSVLRSVDPVIFFESNVMLVSPWFFS
jgi:hypothetical protein